MRDRRNLCETGQNALNQFYTGKIAYRIFIWRPISFRKFRTWTSSSHLYTQMLLPRTSTETKTVSELHQRRNILKIILEKVCNQMEDADENFRSYFLESTDASCPDILFCGQRFSSIENLNRTEIICDLEQIKIDRQLEIDGICDRKQEFDWLMGNFTEEFSNDEFREIFFTNEEEAKCPNLNICGRLVFFQPVISSSWYRTIGKISDRADPKSLLW